MTVTAEGALSADANEGAADIGSGTTGFGVDSFPANALSDAVVTGGDAGFAGSAGRFVTFCTDGLTGGSVSTRVLATGGSAAAVERGAGAVVAVADEPDATSAESSRGSRGCCSRAASLSDGCRGTAIVAITSTAAPASVTMCPRVGCHGAAGRVTGTVTLVEGDSTAA